MPMAGVIIVGVFTERPAAIRASTRGTWWLCCNTTHRAVHAVAGGSFVVTRRARTGPWCQSNSCSRENCDGCRDECADTDGHAPEPPCLVTVFGDVARFVDGSVCACGVDHIGIVKIRVGGSVQTNTQASRHQLYTACGANKDASANHDEARVVVVMQVVCQLCPCRPVGTPVANV
jgi:hypothetical protein